MKVLLSVFNFIWLIASFALPKVLEFYLYPSFIELYLCNFNFQLLASCLQRQSTMATLLTGTLTELKVSISILNKIKYSLPMNPDF